MFTDTDIKGALNELGLDSGADWTSIKKQYHRLALKFHPDHCREADKKPITARFQEILEAYLLLRDAYAELGSATVNPEPDSSYTHFFERAEDGRRAPDCSVRHWSDEWRTRENHSRIMIFHDKLQGGRNNITVYRSGKSVKFSLPLNGSDILRKRFLRAFYGNKFKSTVEHLNDVEMTVSPCFGLAHAGRVFDFIAVTREFMMPEDVFHYVKNACGLPLNSPAEEKSECEPEQEETHMRSHFLNGNFRNWPEGWHTQHSHSCLLIFHQKICGGKNNITLWFNRENLIYFSVPLNNDDRLQKRLLQAFASEEYSADVVHQNVVEMTVALKAGSVQAGSVFDLIADEYLIPEDICDFAKRKSGLPEGIFSREWVRTAGW